VQETGMPFETLAQQPVLRVQILDDDQPLAAVTASDQNTRNASGEGFVVKPSLAQRASDYPTRLISISGHYDFVVCARLPLS
jgi:hypothetical protein